MTSSYNTVAPYVVDAKMGSIVHSVQKTLHTCGNRIGCCFRLEVERVSHENSHVLCFTCLFVVRGSREEFGTIIILSLSAPPPSYTTP